MRLFLIEFLYVYSLHIISWIKIAFIRAKDLRIFFQDAWIFSVLVWWRCGISGLSFSLKLSLNGLDYQVKESQVENELNGKHGNLLWKHRGLETATSPLNYRIRINRCRSGIWVSIWVNYDELGVNISKSSPYHPPWRYRACFGSRRSGVRISLPRLEKPCFSDEKWGFFYWTMWWLIIIKY